MSLAAPFLRAHRRRRSGAADPLDASGSARRSARRHPASGPPRVLLVGSGDHAAELRPVLEGLPESADVVVVLRMATREDRIRGADLAELTLRRGGRLVELSGTRAAVALDADRLRSLVADLAGRDVHASGPPSFVAAVVAAARAAGVPEPRTHYVAGVR